MMMMMHQKPTVYLPTLSYVDDVVYNSDSDDSDSIDTFSSDDFRMYGFKIRRCARARPHDWTECPFAHPGEKARRRDPRRFHYSGTACPDFRKGGCKKGDSCDMAHGVFECWLHPARYRTQPCKDGTACRRRVCFFAHSPEQLRVLATSPRTPLDSYDGSPMRKAAAMMASSPPMSPRGEVTLVSSLRKLQLEKVKSMPPVSSGGFGVGFGSPRFCSLPSTPTRALNGGFDGFFGEEGEENVERVESGRALRAKMYERLCRESALMEKEPDVGWVSELLK